ncbi:PREDICTED: uncharacterized protein LOC105145370 [Acromyrmex echinatior]|uniref:uncharacterized protein LOC105145370 n=1 Tax=Acromyrmex echinatior TaxID=103372 RepID=UPI000580D54D|nr:PREDICTED: uncharacterized protein LOC105145370 [Acromyrmex echinatior]
MAHAFAGRSLPSSYSSRRGSVDPRDASTPVLDPTRPSCGQAMAASVRDVHSVEGCHSATSNETFLQEDSKAVHLEAVSDYTTDAFLAALRRFTSRRGLCTDIYSHYGTNFSDADRQLREILRASFSEGRQIAHVATSEGIRWHFNFPSAPHFGDLWEATVKSAKYHLRRTISETRLTFEEMSTLLAQVEACMNSRPMHALSDDSDDLTALTSGHLLIGAPLLAIPEPSLSDERENLISKWQLIQRMQDHFWQRWSREYLHTLATRPKWTKEALSPRIGSLYIIRSEISSPNKWSLARITQLHPGDDGVVRVVTLKTTSSELIRPLIKLVLLPEDANAFTSHDNAPNEKRSMNQSLACP